MAISFIAGASANTTTVALPGTAQAGDLAIVVAGRSNAGGPSIPGDWNDLGVISGGSGGSAHGQRAGWKILTSTDISNGNVGTWSNAAAILVLVYRGAEAVSANNGGTGASSNTITFPARSSLGSGSWVVAVSSHRSATDVNAAAATDYTNRSGGFTSTAVGGMDTNGAVASVVQRTDGVNASSGNVGRTMEVTEASVPDPVSGSGGLSFAVTAPAATGAESFDGSGGNAFAVTGLSGESKLIFRTVGGIALAVTAPEGSGDVTITGYSGSGGLEFDVTALDGDGVQSFSGTGAAEFAVTALDGSGDLEFAGGNGLTWEVTALSGEGTVDNPVIPIDGSGGLTFTTSLNGTGSVPVVEASPGSGGGSGGTVRGYTLIPIHWGPRLDDDEADTVQGWAIVVGPKPRIAGTGVVKNPLPVTGSASMRFAKVRAEAAATYTLRITGSASIKIDDRARLQRLAEDELISAMVCAGQIR